MSHPQGTMIDHQPGCARAVDVDDARQLLDVLGLLP